MVEKPRTGFSKITGAIADTAKRLKKAALIGIMFSDVMMGPKANGNTAPHAHESLRDYLNSIFPPNANVCIRLVNGGQMNGTVDSLSENAKGITMQQVLDIHQTSADHDA